MKDKSKIIPLKHGIINLTKSRSFILLDPDIPRLRISLSVDELIEIKEGIDQVFKDEIIAWEIENLFEPETSV